MKQVVFRSGTVALEDVPRPKITTGQALIQVHYSVISPGTEVSSLLASGDTLWRKALKQPDKIQKAFKTLKEKGVGATLEKTKMASESGEELWPGYSCSGVVLDTSDDIHDLARGDRVACAGAGMASHAQFVSVPRNLIVKIPSGTESRDAAAVALGAIALQGVRRADLQLGETAAVIGLGLIGQLTVQLLQAAGCRVIGFDPRESRTERARKLGAERAAVCGESDPIQEALRFSAGRGVDAAVICASTKSDLPLEQAVEMTRKKGKVVIVGAVGMKAPRPSLYEKEIELRLSCSYGPGRYDPDYEEGGIDYPFPYVRWTENRNMEEYLKLLGEGKINFPPLITGEFPLEEAPRAYRDLMDAGQDHLAVVLTYPGTEDTPGIPPLRKGERRIHLERPEGAAAGAIRVALIGAGAFARAIHLPNLQRLSSLYALRAVADLSGPKSKQAARKFGAAYCTTDYREVLDDPDIELVIIATRHHLHAALAGEALRAGKAIFLEKPMAVTREELGELLGVIEETRLPFLVGFNRRFSPTAVRAKEILSAGGGPFIVNYRVNAEPLPAGYWVNTPEGGGRIIGEACHMFDLFNFFTGEVVTEINAAALKKPSSPAVYPENFVVQLKYSGGSLCSLTYTSLGNDRLGKEYIEIFTGGKVLTIDDFRELRIVGAPDRGIKSRTIEKGHREELEAFARFIRGKQPEPIPLGELVSATEISFQADELCRKQDGE